MVFKGRYFIIFIFVIWISQACLYASQMGPLTEPEEFIPKYHPAIKGWTIMSENFTSQEERSEKIELQLVWGLKDIDRTGENRWNPEFVGKLIFDDEFNPATVES
jgi:hypothetical protein